MNENSARSSESLCRRHLETLLAIMRRLASEPRLDPLLASIAEETCNLLDAERATLFLYDAKTDELYSRVATQSEIEVIRTSADRGIAGTVARQKACVIVPDAYADPRFNPDVDRRTGWRTRNMVAVPMTNLAGQLVGVLEALNKRGGSFTADDAALLTALADQAGVALERARLLEDFLEKGRLENEMALARDIQVGLLPRTPPRLDGFDLAGWSHPSEYAGGDFFDLFPWGNGCVGMMIGDAVGHGVGPALLAAETRAHVRALALHETEPEAVLTHANQLLADDVTEGRFVTLALAAVAAADRTVRWASAGHGPVVVLQADGRSRKFAATGLPLGIMPETPVESGPPIALGIGDAFLLVSDGIFECAPPDGEEIGIDAVIRTAIQNLGEPAPALLAAIEAMTESIRPDRRFDDDRTAVVAKRVC
jgi:phosphoserine phosphatase